MARGESCQAIGMYSLSLGGSLMQDCGASWHVQCNSLARLEPVPVGHVLRTPARAESGRGPVRKQGDELMTLRTGIKAGKLAVNHNQTVARKAP